MKKVFVLAVLLLNIHLFAEAQDIKYGFRAGLNYSTILSESEQDANGMDVESFDFITGFHVGGGIKYQLSELFGLGVEIMYSQKGVKYKYDGQAFKVFTSINGDRLLTNGTVDQFLNVNSSYLDIPLTVYGKFWDRLELFAGANIGILIGSSANGELKYTSSDINGGAPLELILDYGYYTDDVGEGISQQTEDIAIGLNPVAVHTTVGAYYDVTNKEKPYGLMDLGLNAGFAVYLNKGLYVSIRGTYGLVDITRQEGDYSKTLSNGLDLITRDDKDRNLNLEASIGFTF